MPITIAIYAHEDFSPYHISIPFTVFNKTYFPETFFNLIICGEICQQAHLQDNFNLRIDHTLNDMLTADIIIIPHWVTPETKPSNQLTEILIEAHNRDIKLVGLCLGAYALAYTGLLDNKSASTHWAYKEDFETRFPKIHLNTDVLYTDLGQIITSAGAAAALDCCLHIVQHYYGTNQANNIARYLVSPRHRQGNETQFIRRPLPASLADKHIQELQYHIQKHLSEKLDIASMANKVGMSRRTFTRRFHAATGMSPMHFITAHRLNYAQELLETTNLDLESIALKSGFSTKEAFARNFKQHFNIPPGQWSKNRIIDLN